MSILSYINKANYKLYYEDETHLKPRNQLHQSKKKKIARKKSKMARKSRKANRR